MCISLTNKRFDNIKMHGATVKIMKGRIRVSSDYFFQIPTKCTLYILHIFFTKPFLRVSVCYRPSSGRNVYTGSKVSAFYKVGWSIEEVINPLNAELYPIC